jgi:N-dimethylarginine dimethylaminohydrolase
VLSFTRLDIVVMQQRVKFSLPQIVFRRRPPVSYQLCIVRSSLTQQSRAGERCEFDPTSHSTPTTEPLRAQPDLDMYSVDGFHESACHPL